MINKKNKTHEEYLQKYAQLIVEVGVNVQQQQMVVLQINVELVELARLIVKEAYKRGAAEVIVKWVDEHIQKEFLLYGDKQKIQEIPEYKKAEIDFWVEEGASRISIVSSNPDAFMGVPADKITAYRTATGKTSQSLLQACQTNQISWTVAAAASPEWAKKIFPDMSSEKEQLAALWDMIFKTTRIYSEDPVQAWREHEARLEKKAQELNEEQFDALHYQAPGTDLIIGLPKNHLWEGAGSFNARGERFLANMPTEEVFTAPDFSRVDGVVTSTKPLSYGGTTINGMEFTFAKGEIISAKATEGEEVLLDLLATDEGAKRLGEVALVPDPSPISQSGIIFYNTLFDENASNHLAIGSAYAFNLQGGTEMTPSELKNAGLNSSQTHVDFMIGSNEMNIDGIREDGTRIPLFRNGDWA